LEIVGKHTRSWNSSPKARTPSRGRAGDRAGLRRAGAAGPHQVGVPAARQATRDPGPATPTRPGAPTRPRPSPPNALSPTERQQVLEVLHDPRFCDLPPAQVWARLLDHGSTWPRSRPRTGCCARGESRDRRRQRTHPARVKLQLVATRPNDVWSWNITKLPGPDRGSCLDL
jgi:hypothetical protein